MGSGTGCCSSGIPLSPKSIINEVSGLPSSNSTSYYSWELRKMKNINAALK